MAKKTLIVISALFLMISGIIYWQWRAFHSEESVKHNVSHKIRQHVTVETYPDGLQITQIIQNLPGGKEYRLNPPAMVTKWSCVTDEGKPCRSDDQDPATFKPQAGELRVQFYIPFNDRKKSFLLSDWLMKVKNTDIFWIELEIVDSTRKTGTWVASLPFKGNKQLRYINYYFFAGNGKNPALYWQQRRLYRTVKNKYLSYYTENPAEKPACDLKNEGRYPYPVYMAIIHSKEHPAWESLGMHISSQGPTLQTFRDAWLNDYFSSKLVLQSKADAWLVEVFSALAEGKDVASPKGKFIMKQLKEKLNQSERHSLLKNVLKKKQLDVKELDRLLGNLKGLDTRFFSNNRGENQRYIPLAFYDRRPVSVNQKFTAGLHPLTQGDTLFFPFAETVRHLGFHVHVKQGQVLLQKKGSQITFYLHENRFNKNGQEYGLLATPFKEYDGKRYINQSGLQAIFNVHLFETKSNIFIIEK